MKLYRVIYKNIGNHEGADETLHTYQELPYLYKSREAAEKALNNFKKERYTNHEYNVKYNPNYNIQLQFHLYELVGIVEVEVP